jgi:hypothetical protein
VVSTGTGTVTFTDWYAGNKAVTTLQMIIEGTRDYSATSSNPLNNKKIQEFNFTGLTDAFDAARAAGKTFSVSANLATYRLSGSDTDAYGGAIAYQWGRNSALTSLTNAQIRAIASAPEYGNALQSTTPPAGAAALSEPAAAGSTATDAGTAQDATFVAAPTLSVSSASSTDTVASADTPQSAPTSTAPAPSDGVEDRMRALIERWFEQADEKPAIALSDFAAIMDGTPSTLAPADETTIAARWRALDALLGTHLSEYADVGNGVDGALTQLRLASPATGSVVDAVGLAPASGMALKPLQGLNEGLARL